jgi:predicted metalloprotease with PDZ domain
VTHQARRLVPALLLACALMPALAAPAAAKRPAKKAMAPPAGPIHLDVDLRDAPRRIYHAKLTMPVAAGPLTLYYPQWIPGEHGPTGPLSDLVGLTFTAGGQKLAWQRDPVEMYSFHLQVPAGADSLEVTLDYVAPGGSGNFTAGASSSDDLTVLSWNTVLLYPAGHPAADYTYQASLTLPDGWQWGTALPVASANGDHIDFQPASLVTLIDSPVSTGVHYRKIVLATAPVSHEIDLVADSDAALAMPADTEAAYKKLVAEALALFGAYHYRDYHFLFTLSDHVASFGLEHHESSDDRVGERTLVDDDMRTARSGLLPHEYVHSWNAKFRRPAGLATPDYQTPMVDDLLWVYEGLTSYLGAVLTSRSGLLSEETSRDDLALIAAGLDNRPGRTWRPLADTTRAAQILYGARPEWSSWRRGVDFYDEGVMIWLEADTVIRQTTGGAKSLDDFCKAFYGPPSGTPDLKPYTFDDLVAALNAVAPYDWRGFFTSRVDAITPHAPLGGITAGGWKLVYTPTIGAYQKAIEESRHMTDERFSIGIQVHHQRGGDDDGLILDAIPGFPAAEAGIGPGMKLVAVDGRRWSPELLRAAITAAQTQKEPIELLVENSEYFHTYRLDYHGGERFPHLERDASKPDLLSDILAAKTAP